MGALFKRARKPEHKAQRRKAILDSALHLFDRKGFEATSMSAIACRARLSKGNLYRYFKSKEELFLNLYQKELGCWIERLQQELTALPRGDRNPAGVAALLARTMAGAPRLASMTPLLSAVIERNVSTAGLATFRGALMKRAGGLARTLCQVLPGLEEEQGLFIIMMVHVLVAGLWPAAHPAPAMERVLEQETFSLLRLDFQRDLQRASEALIRGIL